MAADIDLFVEDASNFHGAIGHNGIKYMMMTHRTTTIAFANIDHIPARKGMITNLLDNIEKLIHIEFSLIYRPVFTGIAGDVSQIVFGCLT